MSLATSLETECVAYEGRRIGTVHTGLAVRVNVCASLLRQIEIYV
jgi:hypothetical protein